MRSVFIETQAHMLTPMSYGASRLRLTLPNAHRISGEQLSPEASNSCNGGPRSGISWHEMTALD